VGSLLRPPEVLQAHAAHAEQRISAKQLRDIEDEAILKALQLQHEVGLDVLSDGEYRRSSWSGDFASAVDGYVPGSPPIAFEWQTRQGPRTPEVRAALQTISGRVIGERLRQRRRLTAHESGFLLHHVNAACKITMPAPSYIVARGYQPGISDKVYKTRADVLADVVAILRAEVQALVAEGVPYIQLDNPHYPDYIPEDRRAQWRSIGIDPDAALQEDLAADNACLEGVDRARVTLAMHICRGNSRSAWHTQGGYEPIAEQVFDSLQVDRFLLEYDSERAGGFEPLRFVTRGKLVVLGLITTKQGELESQDVLRKRIDEAARHVPLEHLALSPQCGFASVQEGNLLSWDEQRRKLELVVDTARRVWG
jgi:5-methyltetrahydropteroyltriglutamate--homocysteine methyltransferase